MAEKLNLSKSNYTKIENGAVSITLERLDEICNILEVEPQSLIFGDYQNPFFFTKRVAEGPLSTKESRETYPLKEQILSLEQQISELKKHLGRSEASNWMYSQFLLELLIIIFFRENPIEAPKYADKENLTSAEIKPIADYLLANLHWLHRAMDGAAWGVTEVYRDTGDPRMGSTRDLEVIMPEIFDYDSIFDLATRVASHIPPDDEGVNIFLFSKLS